MPYLRELVYLIGFVHRGVEDQLVDTDVLECMHCGLDGLACLRDPSRNLTAKTPRKAE